MYVLDHECGHAIHNDYSVNPILVESITVYVEFPACCLLSCDHFHSPHSCITDIAGLINH